MGQGVMGPSRPLKSILLVCCNHSKVYSTSGTHKKQPLKQNQTGLLPYSPNCGESLRSSNIMLEPGLVSQLCQQGQGEGGGRKSLLAAPCFPPPPLEDCRRPILIKLIKPAPFKELQPHATRGEEENIKLKRKKSPCKHAPPKLSISGRSLMDNATLEEESPEKGLAAVTQVQS